MAKMLDAVAIEPVQPTTVRSCPDCPARVLGNRPLRARAQAPRIISIREVVRERLTIEAIKARFRSDPPFACGTYCECVDHIIAWAVDILRIVPICGESFRHACPPVDPGGSHADPQCARGIRIQSALVDN